MKDLNQIYRESAEKFGTPQFILSDRRIEERIKKLREVFKRKDNSFRVFYPYKANNLPYFCRKIHEIGIGAEVSSLMELELALDLGAPEIIFNGPGKSNKALKKAIEARDKVKICIDSFSELERISKISEKNIKVSARLNLNSKFSKWNKFGFTPGNLSSKLGKFEEEGIELRGLNFHTGSEKSFSSFRKRIKRIKKFIEKISPEKRKKLEFIDIGGGFGVRGYRKVSSVEALINLSDFEFPFINKILEPFRKEKGIGIKEIAEIVFESINDNIMKLKGIEDLRIFIEPGRWISNPCFDVIAEAIDVKSSGIILDANTSFLPHLFFEEHPVYNLSNSGNEKMRGKVYGNLCKAGDILSRSYRGGKAEKGDLFCIKNIGAYSISESKDFIGARPCVVSYNGDRLKIVRKKEEIADRTERDIY